MFNSHHGYRGESGAAVRRFLGEAAVFERTQRSFLKFGTRKKKKSDHTHSDVCSHTPPACVCFSGGFIACSVARWGVGCGWGGVGVSTSAAKCSHQLV